MDQINWKIESGANRVKLVWTPRWLLSPTVMEDIVADTEKKTASVEITVMSAENKVKVIKNVIWFRSKHH